MRSVFTTTYTSPDTGIPYDVRTETVEDACRDCAGSGEIRFPTFADLRQCVLDRRAFEEDDDHDWDYYPEPEKSGLRKCERCDGTGYFKGDGGLIKCSLSTSLKLGSFPFQG